MVLVFLKLNNQLCFFSLEITFCVDLKNKTTEDFLFHPEIF